MFTCLGLWSIFEINDLIRSIDSLESVMRTLFVLPEPFPDVKSRDFKLPLGVRRSLKLWTTTVDSM